jgi:hypothetical protein
MSGAILFDKREVILSMIGREEDGFEFDLITLRIARLDLSDVTGKKPDKIEYTPDSESSEKRR